MNFVLKDRIDEDEYIFGDSINAKDFAQSLKTVSLVSYKYIDYNMTDYHFFQDCFDNRDIHHYFDFMNILTSDSFDSLLNQRNPEWHLNPNDYNKDKRFRSLVNTLFELESDLPIQKQPSFYHFALYTNKKANRERGTKSPRIYFFIGTKAVIYPLFYDPYHEINP